MRVASYGKVRLLTALCPRTNTSIANSISSWLFIVEASAACQTRLPNSACATKDKAENGAKRVATWSIDPEDIDRDTLVVPLSGVDRRQGERSKRKISLVGGHLTGLQV